MNRILLAVVVSFLCVTVTWSAPPELKVLFLGDRPGGHRPAERFKQIETAWKAKGISLTYTADVAELNEKNLAGYDAVMIYSNINRITPDQEKALIDFVESGKGFCPIHCASFCFLNSPKYIALVGAQFKSHGTGTFRVMPAEKATDHPILKGYSGFESWDETYIHAKHNETDRTVLEFREAGGTKEPWTWVRSQGKGRVFYTAWGHDQRTWGNPGFQELLERGLRWSVGQDPTTVKKPSDNSPDKPQADAKAAPASPFTRPFPVPDMKPKRTDVAPFEYLDVGPKIPNYPKSTRWGVQDEPLSKMQKPVPADESLKHLVLPQGFEARVFVTEQELGGKPICMTWDERGRLWCCLTMDYPNELKQPTQGRDKIVVCEDTKGTGRCDKVTVFAEGLSIPTSLMFYKGSVIAFDARQTVQFTDRDGDGKADERKVLFGTWAQNDTHGGPSNMNYGLDNWIYAMQGYNNSTLQVGGETHRLRQGFLRFKPDASKLEFLRSTNNNTWGLGLSEEGIVFGSTANSNPSEYMPIPNRYYEMVKGWAPQLTLRGIADSKDFHPVTDRVRQVDVHGGFTAAAGHALYTARQYPQEYWNRTAFVNEPTGHLVATFVIRQEGSHFRSNNSFNLVASDDEWTAPIMSEVGPDGNVWMLDWYNFIVQHNPTPRGFTTGKGAAYESDLRDKKHGRIYRIVYTAGDAAKSPSLKTLAGATPEQLVTTLTNDNLFWRRHAQRLLVERGQRDVVPALLSLIRNPTMDAIGLNVGAIHALWTLHGLDALDGSQPDVTAVAIDALKHPSSGVRRNAVQVLPKSDRSVAAILQAGVLNDPEPQVRLMSLLALADQPSGESTGIAVAEMLTTPENANDKWMPDAATAAAAGSSAGFLKSVSRLKSPPTRVLTVAGIVAEHYARNNPTESLKGVLLALAPAEPNTADSIVRGLAKGWPAKSIPTLDAETEDALVALSNRLNPERRGTLVRLASGWGSKRFAAAGAEVLASLKSRLSDDKESTDTRIAAASEWLGYAPTDVAAVTAILDQITPQAAPELSLGLLRALRSNESAETGKLIVGRMPTLTPAGRAAGATTLLTRAEWTRALVDAADAGTIQVTELALDQKQMLLDHPDTRLRDRARALFIRGGALPNADRQKVIEEFADVAKTKGDPANGKVVFQNQCSKCHLLNGVGTAIGPDLTGMAVHPKDELLIHILDPSRSVEGNFRLYKVNCKDGQVLQGMLAGESKTSVELVDTEGKKITVLRDNIEELKGTAKSLMPDGFEKQVSKKEMGDLLEYLTQKGKYLPLSLEKVATSISTIGLLTSEANAAEQIVFPDWKPKVFGGVPFQLIDPANKRQNVLVLNSPRGVLTQTLPRNAVLPCQTTAKAIHFLGGVGGWSHPQGDTGSVSLIVRLHYDDGKTEDHEWKNGVHVADFSKRVDVPESQFAFDLRGRQVRFLSVTPKRTNQMLKQVELVKGPNDSAPMIFAVTVESP